MRGGDAHGSAGRLVLPLMCALATFVSYIDRVAISIAILPMGEEQGWSAATRGLVLSSFFIGYAVAMVPAGWLAARFGGRLLMGAALLLWSCLTLVTPLAASVSLGALVLTRVLLGVSEAANFPAAYNLFGHRLAREERTRAAATNLAGIPLGTAFALSTAGWLIDVYGWPTVFVTYGAIGLVATLAWFSFVPNRLEAQSARNVRGVDAVPWRTLTRHPAVWALVFNHFCVNWTLYMMLTWLPSYFRDAHHLSVVDSGFFSIAPWFCQFGFSMAAASFADRRIAAGAKVVSVRRAMQCVGLVGSAVFLIAASQAASPVSALLCTCGALGLNGVTWAGFATNHLDIAPRHADVLWGLTNTAGSLPGIVGVAVTGALIETSGGFAAPFILAAVLSAAGAVVWLFWSSGDEIAL